MTEQETYPPDAYAPNGVLWWKLKVTPGTRRQPYGDENKLAAWLAFNRAVGETFTMRQLRTALGEEKTPNYAEHLNRRLRTLRARDGWEIPSARDDGTLGSDEYRVKTIGWHPGTGRPRAKTDLPSEKVRREVFERDKETCQVCGVISGEPYDDLPGRTARMTLGHRVPGNRLSGNASADDLRAECSRCNESLRDLVFNPVTLPELEPRVAALSRKDKERLLDWLEAGRRSQAREEIIYAEARRLSTQERRCLITKLRRMTGRPALDDQPGDGGMLW